VGAYYRDFFPDFDRAKYRDMLEKMQLPPKTKVKQLSSGMLAKLKLAATLSRDSELIMLDEPLNGIDIIARDQVIEAIRERISPERTFLLSSHLGTKGENRTTRLHDRRIGLEGTVRIREKTKQGLVDCTKR
jgi:ABC-2 type transport system ATP-binding protein